MENYPAKKTGHRSASLLLVDDNAELLSGLKLFLNPWFDSIDVIRNPNLIPSRIQSSRYDVILLDMNFTAEITSGNEGIYWLRQIVESDPDAVVVMITAYGDIELAVKAVKEGAADFISKSWDEEKILSTLISALKLSHSKKEIKKLKTQQKHLSVQEDQGHSIFNSRARSMTGILRCIEKTAPTDANILILGENGTGKEIVAREIHRLSNRSDNIFVHLDLGSLSDPLFESELFGYKKGAFTDAKEDKPGRIEIASGGTLLLDEIGNLPLHLQTKLLSVIQNQEIVPLGGTRPVGVDVRLISATNSPLETMIKEGSFREDLYFRINTIQIEVPPLRERKEDIGGLANYFLKRFSARYKTDVPALSEKAAEKLLSYNWPGNIRELMHTIEKAVILAEDKILKPDDFTLNDKVKKHGRIPGSFNLSENEKHLIESAIETFDGNMSRVARELGINRSTLYEKIKKYNTPVPGNN
ncbi:MAG: sigma-54-dependent Fis family transcriptional regulator [Marinilabiliales bacterium]|nr:MAG: sigma-54-dependent Fis family transcriptional regulator [Marinilabiliales bacterium]